MTFRNILLGVGILFMVAGIGLIFVWFGAAKNPPAEPQQPEQKVEVKVETPPPAILAATHFISSGTLIRKGDLFWKEVGPGEISPGSLLRGQTSETQFLGAISRKDFAEGEAIIPSELVLPGDAKFLSSVLKPGGRAVTISVDAAEVVAGLVLPGDQVDVLLTQTFNDNVASQADKKVVSETVLRNVRVIALDQTLYRLTGGSISSPGPAVDSHVPKLVTLELFGSQPERILVAKQMGKLQLAVLPIETAQTIKLENKSFEQVQNPKDEPPGKANKAKRKHLPAARLTGQAEVLGSGVSRENTGEGPVWSSEVSSAFVRIPSSTTGSTLENLIRLPIAPSSDSPSAAPYLRTPESGGGSPDFGQRRQ